MNNPFVRWIMPCLAFQWITFKVRFTFVVVVDFHRTISQTWPHPLMVAPHSNFMKSNGSYLSAVCYVGPVIIVWLCGIVTSLPLDFHINWLDFFTLVNKFYFLFIYFFYIIDLFILIKNLNLFVNFIITNIVLWFLSFETRHHYYDV